MNNFFSSIEILKPTNLKRLFQEKATDSITFDFLNFSELNISNLEKILGYVFKEKSTLVNALIHRSIRENNVKGNKGGKIYCYERMEHLGDAIVDFIFSQYALEENPDEGPGKRKFTEK